MAAFEWDPAKAEANERKHGILFGGEAVSVFDDDNAITLDDIESDPSEKRFITVGMSHKGRLIVVVYARRGRDDEDHLGAESHISRRESISRHE